jgi:glycosyltransferase involved in cell wall biosynthesis
MYPKVTISIPTYNQQGFIQKAIESALAQTYENIEIVIADDCSTDQTAQVVSQYLHNENIRYFRNEINIGRTRTYKKALEEYATGEWLANLDGDDYFTDPDFISNTMHLIQSYPEKNIVFAQAGHEQKKQDNSIYSKLNVPKLKGPYLCLSGIEYFLNFFKLNHFSHVATLYKRKNAIETGFYINDILSSDINSLLKLALTGDVILINKSIGVWMKHEHNASGDKNFSQSYQNMLWIEDCYEFAKKYIGIKELKPWLKSARKSFLLGLTYKMCDTKNRNLIYLYLKELWPHEKAIFTNPRFIRLLILGFIKSFRPATIFE